MSVPGFIGSRLALASGEPAGAGVAWDVVSAAFLLLFPVCMALLLPPVRGNDHTRWVVKQRWLIALSLAAGAVWSAWWITTGTPLRSVWLFGAYVPLLGLAIVVVNLKRLDPAIGPAAPAASGGGARTASLSPRTTPNEAVPTRAWIVLALAACVAMTACVARFAAGFGDRGEVIRAGSGLLMATLALGEVVLFAWVVRRVLPREPRPLDPRGSAELTEGYERLTRLRARGMFVLGALLTLMLASGGVLVAWIGADMDGRALGIAGAIVGSAVGLAGGVFGAWCSLRAMKLQDRRVELTGETPRVGRCPPAIGEDRR